MADPLKLSRDIITHELLLELCGIIDLSICKNAKAVCVLHMIFCSRCAWVDKNKRGGECAEAGLAVALNRARNGCFRLPRAKFGGDFPPLLFLSTARRPSNAEYGVP